MGCARAGVRGERAAEAPGGGPTWQSIMASSSFSSIFFSPVSAHRRASRTGPSGRPPSFFRGASQSVDKAIGSQVEKLSLKDPSNCPGEGTMLFAEGKRLSHSQPATDSKIQPHITGKGAQTLGKTQPDPQILSDTQEKIRSDPCIYLDTWRIPQPYPHLHLDEYGEIQYRQSNRIYMIIHTGDTDRSSEIVRQRERHTHSDAPRHVEETHADPWIHPEIERDCLTIRQPYPHGEDTARPYHTAGYIWGR